MEKIQIELYTDGACSGNPGVGGWGAILLFGDLYKEFCGAEGNTTNNRMELTAVVKGLSALKMSCLVNVYSDSAYVVNAFTQGWLDNWQKNGWRGADKKEVKNQDLWKELLRLTQFHDVKFNKVKGHADNELNNRCDTLATGAIVEYNKANVGETV